MRNVPPSPANYDQRVGRAGRRLKIGIAITYCGYSNHDQRFFENPPEMIKGEIKEPIFSMNNEPLFRRHIHSFIFTTLFLNSEEKDFELLKKAIPNKIVNYLFEDIAHAYHKNNINKDLVKYYREIIHSKKDILVKELMKYFTFWKDSIDKFKIIYDAETENELAEKLIESSILNLEKILKYTRDLYLYWLEKSDEMHQKRALYNPYNDILNKFIGGSDEYYTLNYLKNHGFLPGYNLVKPGITIFQVPEVEFFRPYSIAIREVAPFSTVYVNGKQYTIKDYTIFSSKEKDFVKRFDIHTPNGVEEIYAMHITDVELNRGEKIKSNDTGRKKAPYAISVDFDKFKGHIGGMKYETTSGINVEFYRNATLYLINTGSYSRGQKLNFYICPECGYVANKKSEEDNKKDFINHIKNKHNNFKNDSFEAALSTLKDKGISIYSKHKSDILLIGGFEELSEAVSVGEAIRLGSSLVTDISESDISLDVEYKNGVHYVILYEDVPGGSGYIEFIFNELNSVIKESIKYLKDCSCKKACYKCLLSYWNQHWHSEIDRNVAIQILEKMEVIKNKIDIPPAIEKDIEEKNLEESYLEKAFFEYLKENGFPLPEKQYEILKPVNTRMDFAYPDKKIAIYLDGKPYHDNPETRRKDQKIDLKLNINGWKVLRITSDDWDDEDMRILKLKILKNYLEE